MPRRYTKPKESGHFIEDPTEARCRHEVSKPTHRVGLLFDAKMIIAQSIVEMDVPLMNEGIAQ
jgi:hypothetical protein